MTTRARLATIPALFAILLLAACSGGEGPTRPVQFAGLLDMVIADVWVLEGGSPEGRIFVHRDLGDVRLHIDARNETWEGGGEHVQSVKGMLGRELNMQYGGVISRISLGGNAMIRYGRDLTDELDEPLRSEEWVLAKPAGWQNVARVDISLQMPPERVADPRIAELIVALDRHVGDAKIPDV